MSILKCNVYEFINSKNYEGLIIVFIKDLN